MISASLIVTIWFGLATGRSFWSSTPAGYGSQLADDYVLKTAYPLGNGRLGAMPFGPPSSEKLLLNVDSLWSEGPFEIANYSGGNPPDYAPKYPALSDIRVNIFKAGTGDVDGLLGSNSYLGPYHVLGNLTMAFDGFSNYSDYKRVLDLTTGTHRTEFTSDSSSRRAYVDVTTYCSYPDQICIWSVWSNVTIPRFSVGFENHLVSNGLTEVECGEDNHVRLIGLTQKGPPEGMKSEAVARLSKDSTATLPTSGAWMAQHVWDYFDYTQDLSWLKEVGYPLLKGGGEFWLPQLQEDRFSRDGSLVVNPCNSPEHGPTTFGCAHDQQEFHQVFDNILSSSVLVGDEDSYFLKSVAYALLRLDRGLHFTEWGGVKEWKIPDSYGYDVKNTHRHLSHLTGWYRYPGYSVSSYQGDYSTNTTIQAALEETLIARGNGTSEEADPGWGKVWRSAPWARLNNTDQAYIHLKYAVETNTAVNGLSMHDKKQPPFQIDANQGYGGAVPSMLSVDLPLPHDAGDDTVRTVVLGPAIPKAWAEGSVDGLRVRGGGLVHFEWDDEGIVARATLEGSRTKVRLVNKNGHALVD
ncbi:unnamed protein product [Clonostachys rhizophaga]|uniref:Uncharacterized protein n=1 Tax=Clonostachys rhizophaga TaxID=160324 RepID=A0A9N9YKR2_9HYPO|nr:unnamed protein product [Clonostachys rhizophaga]